MNDEKSIDNNIDEGMRMKIMLYIIISQDEYHQCANLTNQINNSINLINQIFD